MVQPQTSSRHKWLTIAVVLGLVVVLAGILVLFNRTANETNDSYTRRYYDNPEAAVHISPNGDITVPTTFCGPSNLIHPIGDHYTLTGDLQCELIVEKSNIVFDGEGFAVGYQNGAASNHQTIKLSNVNNVTMQGVVIKGYYTSLLLDNSSNCKILGITGSDIRFLSSNHNAISNSSGAIRFQDSSNNKVANCNTSGLEFDTSNSNSILNSNCTGPGRSLYFTDSSNNLIFGNILKSWWWISMYGDSSHNTIVGNNITISQKYFADSLMGTNYIYHNNFLDFSWESNKTTNSANVWSSNGQGNYWNTYTGKDTNGDGIGDTPFVIDTTNVDSCPLMTPVDFKAEPFPTVT
jgi:hypothetical protein